MIVVSFYGKKCVLLLVPTYLRNNNLNYLIERYVIYDSRYCRSISSIEMQIQLTPALQHLIGLANQCSEAENRKCKRVYIKLHDSNLLQFPP